LLKARERMGWTGRAFAIISRVVVLADPARAFINID
jgi:hypothetical protein